MSMLCGMNFEPSALPRNAGAALHPEDTDLVALPYLDTERRRRVDRIPVSLRSGYGARLHWGQHGIAATIVNYSSMGMKLTLHASAAGHIDTGAPIDSLEIHLCERIIAEIASPQIIRFDESTATLNLSFNREAPFTDTRLGTRSDFAPVVQVKHPMRCSRTIHFIVREFGGQRMLLETSLLNKTLLPGMVIRDAMLLLPGARWLTLDFKLDQVRFQRKTLQFEASFLDPSRELGDALSQFSLHGVDWTGHTVQDIPRLLNAAGLPTRRIGPGLEVDVITNMREFREVLKVRLAAYRGACKVPAGTSVQDMGDEFDPRSIILCARFSGHVVGTVRLVTCETEDQAFPFESCFPNPLQGEVRKALLFEVSRLSILPEYQRTAIVFELFRQVADIAYRAKTPYVFLMSTRMLDGIYSELGTVKVGQPVPHPTLESEVLSLHLLDCNKFWDGVNLSEQVRDAVAIPVLSNYFDPRAQSL